MRWAKIRAHYAGLQAQAQAAGVTQKAIAARGGIGQNDVSRLLANDRLGPSVEIFVRAVEGLGLTLSAFFAEFERAMNETPAAPAAAGSSLSASSASSADRRFFHGGASISPERLTADAAQLDPQQIHVIFQAITESLVARVDRLDAQVAKLGGDDGSVPPRASAARGGRRRRATPSPQPITATQEDTSR